MTTVALECEVNLEIVLVYRGALKTCSRTESRAKDKALLRKHFSAQLERHWNQNKELKEKLDDLRPATIEQGRFLNFIHNQATDDFFRPYIQYGSCCFIPTVIPLKKQFCDMKIVWLRNEAPGAIYNGGDLDGRLKVLFDALRIPHDENEAVLSVDNGSKCFCLLEDDALIRNLRIETGRLLEPMEKPTDIQIQIHATIVEGE